MEGLVYRLHTIWMTNKSITDTVQGAKNIFYILYEILIKFCCNPFEILKHIICNPATLFTILCSKNVCLIKK